MKPSISLSFFVCLLSTGLISATSQNLADLEYSLASNSSKYPHPSQQPEQTFSDYIHARGGYQTYDTPPTIEEEDDDLSTSSIIGIGSAVFAAAVIAPALTYRQKKKREQKEKERLEQETRFAQIEKQQQQQSLTIQQLQQQSPKQIRDNTKKLKEAIKRFNALEALKPKTKSMPLFQRMSTASAQREKDRIQGEFTRENEAIHDLTERERNRQQAGLEKKLQQRNRPKIPRLDLTSLTRSPSRTSRQSQPQRRGSK